MPRRAARGSKSASTHVESVTSSTSVERRQHRYGAAAREAVAGAAEAGLLETNRRVTARLTIKARADKVGDLYRALNAVERTGERHDGTFVEMDVRVYEDDSLSADELAARVGDATAGTATVTETT